MCHVEFAYNKIPSYTTKHSPLECVYRINPLMLVTLMDIKHNDTFHEEAKHQAEVIMKMHAQIRDNINKANEKYASMTNKDLQEKRQFKPGYWVLIHLRKERFLKQRKNKLFPRADDPY